MRVLPLPKGTVPFVLASIMLMLTGAIGGSLYYPEELWAPGNLSRAHSEIKACNSCHQPFQGASTTKCISCHNQGQFSALSKSKITDFHLQVIKGSTACKNCHTEHRGASAQITVAALHNPHGDFVFLATGAKSCRACHTFENHSTSRPELINNSIVRHLMEGGDGAHKLGQMSNCLNCHATMRNDIDKDYD